METQLHKRVFFDDSRLKLEIEDYEDKLLLHCIVTDWKPSVLRRGYSTFKELEQYATDLGYTALMTVTPNPNFAHLFGGTTVQEFEHENTLYEVVVWDLKQVCSQLSPRQPQQ